MALTGIPPTGGLDPLARAAGLARDDAGPDPTGTAGRVMTSVARLTRRPGRSRRPALADIPGGAVWISDVVLRSAVGRAVTAEPDVSPVSVRFRFDGDRVTGVTVGVAVAYRADIASVAAAVRAAVRQQLGELLAMTAVPEVEVEVVDVLDAAEMPGPPRGAIRVDPWDEPRGSDALPARKR